MASSTRRRSTCTRACRPGRTWCDPRRSEPAPALGARYRRNPAGSRGDDLVLRLQRLVDRFARWVRLDRSVDDRLRRFIIVQIDGLSAVAFDKGLAAGQLPHIARLLRTGRLRRQPMSVGLPSSTPAFQLSAMYGVRPDIPGFHYYD